MAKETTGSRYLISGSQTRSDRTAIAGYVFRFGASQRDASSMSIPLRFA